MTGMPRRYWRTLDRAHRQTVADLVNLFDPEVIVVGGEAVQFGDALLDPLKRSMHKFLFFSKPEVQTDWVPSSWGRGAAALATRDIFDFERLPSG